MRHRLRFTPRLSGRARARVAWACRAQQGEAAAHAARQAGSWLVVGCCGGLAAGQAAGLGRVLARLAARGSGRCAKAVRRGAVRGGGVCMGGGVMCGGSWASFF